MPPRITLDVFEALLNCKLKAHLRLTLQEGVKADYEAMITDLRHEVRQRAIDKIRINYNDDTIANALPVKRSTLRAGIPFVLDAELINQRNSIRFDGLKRVDGPSSLGQFHYVPVNFA